MGHFPAPAVGTVDCLVLGGYIEIDFMNCCKVLLDGRREKTTYQCPTFPCLPWVQLYSTDIYSPHFQIVSPGLSRQQLVEPGDSRQAQKHMIGSATMRIMHKSCSWAMSSHKASDMHASVVVITEYHTVGTALQERKKDRVVLQQRKRQRKEYNLSVYRSTGEQSTIKTHRFSSCMQCRPKTQCSKTTTNRINFQHLVLICLAIIHFSIHPPKS